MSIVVPIRRNDHVPRQGSVVEIGGKLRQVDNLRRRTADVAQDVAIPRRTVMSAIVRSTVVVVRGSNGSSRSSIGLGIYLPTDAGVIQFPEDIVIGNRVRVRGSWIVTIISITVKVVGPSRQSAVRG